MSPSDAVPPPPVSAPEAPPGDIQGQLKIILSGIVDLSARVGKVEAALMLRNEKGGSSASAVVVENDGPRPPAISPQGSWTSDYMRSIHDETMRQTPKIDSMIPAVQNAATAVQSVNVKQWVTLAAVILQAIAGFAYALTHSH